jgi:hypothetical protein
VAKSNGKRSKEMKARRSRFRRFYHRLTRSTPDRKSQWQQISMLRPGGSPGHRTGASVTRSYIPYESAVEPTTWRPSDTQTQEAGCEPNESPPAPAEHSKQADSDGSVAVPVLVTSLLVLACTYAGLSGYMHSSNSAVTWLGVLGAIGCLMAAGTGICMSLSRSHRSYSAPFLSIAVVFLTGLCGALLFLSVSH